MVEKLVQFEEYFVVVKDSWSSSLGPSVVGKRSSSTSSSPPLTRKERVLGCLHEGHCHGCFGSLFLKIEGMIFIFFDIFC